MLKTILKFCEIMDELNTISKSDESKPVQHDRQQIVWALAIRGEGKSWLIEGLSEDSYYLGYLGIDLHSPPNLENAFWCIPRLENDAEIIEFKMNPRKFLNKRPAIPVTIVGSESMIWNEFRVDVYNGKRDTFDDWINEGKPIEAYPHALPPLKPKYKQGRELIRIEKLPSVTQKPDSDANKKAWDTIEKILDDCHKQGRIFVLNKKCFSSETQYFWTMALIIRNLEAFSDKYMVKKYPHEVGVETREMMSPRDRNWHKGFIVTRELADLAPARTKADVSGESTQVKKAMMGFARIVRHIEFDWFADWQKWTDVIDSVRSQYDVLLFKKWSRDLAGEKESVFDQIERVRDAIKYRIKNKKKAERISNRYFPRIEELAQEVYYTRFISGHMKLFPVPKLTHLHKEPDMKFHDLTGITIDHDKNLIPKEKDKTDSKTTDNNEKFVYLEMKELKESKLGLVKKSKDILKILAIKQDRGEITYHHEFSKMKPAIFRAIYSRLKRKYSKILNENNELIE